MPESRNSGKVKRHLSVLKMLRHFNFWMPGAHANKACTLTKATSIPARRHNWNTGPRFLRFFRRCPNLEYFVNFSSSALQRHLLKQHLTPSDQTTHARALKTLVGKAYLLDLCAEHSRWVWRIRPSLTRAGVFFLRDTPEPWQLKAPGPKPTINQEKASAEIQGEFFRTKSRVNYAGDLLVDFFGPFSLEKIGGKNPPKNPRQNSNRNLGVSQLKSTLQGSALDN